MPDQEGILAQLKQRFGPDGIVRQLTADGILTVWVPPEQVRAVLSSLRDEVSPRFRMLYDLTAVDERQRRVRPDQPPGDFTVVYRLLSLEGNADCRVKVALTGEVPVIGTVTDLWPNAAWYECELWDMFGIRVEGHPHLRRLLMPPWWEGHPLRKEHSARATEMAPFRLPEERMALLQETLEFRPEDWGWPPPGPDQEDLYLNLGPHHPGTHGVLRVICRVCGETIRDAICDIGFHHRGAEKMGERQSWHTYIPYTDRVDYLGGAMNNLPYVLAVEHLAGIEVPERAQVIRILLAELFRIISHLVFMGTFAQDVGMMSPVFYMFTDRERALDIVETITGARMHPSWFRIGGVAQDLPKGWEQLLRDFIEMLERRLSEYEQAVLRNRIFRARTVGVGAFDVDTAVAWGATGPMLRSAGLAWDLRRQRPYGGYDQFEFDIPIGKQGDCYDRAVVHMEEMRQSLRILRQCLQNMPAGPYKSDHPLATPPRRAQTLRDIETLIHHFLSVSWGPVIPPGEAEGRVEGTKGLYSYYLVSDGGTMSYRTRIRAASFPHLQMLPVLCRGLMVADLIAILASLDFVLADVDR